MNASLCFQSADIHPPKVPSNPPKYATYYHLRQQYFIPISEGLNHCATTVSVIVGFNVDVHLSALDSRAPAVLTLTCTYVR